VTRNTRKWLHEGKYAAEVPVELIEDDTAWSPYLSPEDVYKLDTVRLALQRGERRRSLEIWTSIRVETDRRRVIKTAVRIIDHAPEAWPGLDPGASDGGGE